MGSIFAVHWLSCSAYRIFLDQDWNSCLLHLQADQTLYHWATREALVDFFFMAIRIKYQMIFQNHEWKSERCQVPLLWGSILKSTGKADSCAEFGEASGGPSRADLIFRLCPCPSISHSGLSMEGQALLVPSRNFIGGPPLGTAKVLGWSSLPKCGAHSLINILLVSSSQCPSPRNPTCDVFVAKFILTIPSRGLPADWHCSFRWLQGARLWDG